MVKRLQYLAGLIKEDLDLSYNPMSNEERRIDRGILQEEFDLSDNPFSSLLYDPGTGYKEEKLRDFFKSLDSKPFSFNRYLKIDNRWSSVYNNGFGGVFVAEAPMNLFFVFQVMVKPTKKGEQVICYYIKLANHKDLFDILRIPVIKKECETLTTSLTSKVLKQSIKTKMDSYYRTAVNSIKNKNSYVMGLIDDLNKTK
jgi:hypothetical protein